MAMRPYLSTRFVGATRQFFLSFPPYGELPMTHEKTCERIAREDPQTGVKIIQLTSFPLMHFHLGSGQWTTPDDRTLLLSGNRYPTRDSPRDLYRVESDGSGLMLLAREPSGGVISADRSYVYAGRKGSFIRIPFEGGDEEEVARMPGYLNIMVSTGTLDGRYVFAQGQRTDRTFDVMRLDLTEGRVERICRARYLMPVQLVGRRSERLLASILPIDEAGAPRMPWGVWTFSFDGDGFALVPFTRSTNHYAPLGRTGDVVTTVNHPGRALDVATPGDAEVRVLAEGAGFWHVSCDATGEWAASDTNWPDVGLQLIHAPSGRFRTLCRTGASGGHPQWTHAHPVLAPNAGYVVYTSDRTGICQVYLAHIPEEFKAEFLT